MPAIPSPPPLHATVIMDYQNVHLVGHDTFTDSWATPRHTTLIDPLLFSEQLINARNSTQRSGYAEAVLDQVLVYRGLPSSEYDPADNARNLSQQHHWQRDRQVKVIHRPLRYRVNRDASGKPVLDVNGKPSIIEKREKGVDVLCALAVVREARRPGNNVVILASHDSDLEPALDEAFDLNGAKIEIFRWDSPTRYTYQLRCTDRRRRLWCTKLDEQAFVASRDLTPYG